MKTKSDPRHKVRVEMVKSLFAHNFSEKQQGKEIEAILKKRKNIDLLIKKHAPAWPISQISEIDLAILRVSIWELVFAKNKEPYKVIIDEAVEIAKEFGQDQSAQFVNGVLGTVVKGIKKES